MKRRDFLKNSALASSVMFAPNFVNAANNLVFTNTGQKRLVIIQLSGGNDGLNTVIPVDNDIYYKNRPNIAIEKNKALQLNDTISLNPNLIGLQKLYDKGKAIEAAAHLEIDAVINPSETRSVILKSQKTFK